VSSGGAVQGGAVGPVMLGALSVPTCAMLFSALAPLWGIAAAAAASWVGAVLLVSVPAFAWLSWRGAVAAGAGAPAGLQGAAAEVAEEEEEEAEEVVDGGAPPPPPAEAPAAKL
jgi:predicted membrane metal-binding protein